MASVKTTQQLFRSAMIAYLTESNGGYLKKYCETNTATGGESVTFNRFTESTAGDGVPSMFSALTTGTAGDMKKVTATIAYISARDYVAEVDMNKTTIDIKSAYVKSLGNAVNRKEDSKILAAIKAEATVVREALGVANGTWADEAAIKKLIQKIRTYQAYQQETIDGHDGLAMVLSKKDWGILSSSNYMIHGDYLNAFGTTPDGKAKTFYGAEVNLIDDTTNLPTGEIWLIPSNTVCFAEWEGSTRAAAEFFETDGMRWHLQAVKSVGVAIAEPTSIGRFSCTAVAPAV